MNPDRRVLRVRVVSLIVVSLAVLSAGQTNNDYYAPAPTKYDSGYGPGGDEKTKVKWQYIRFDLLRNLSWTKNLFWNNTNFCAALEQARQKVREMQAAAKAGVLATTNQWKRAEFELLVLEQQQAKVEEPLYRAYVEYRKPNPLWFIPNKEVRDDFLSETNKLTKEDWKQLEQLEAEKEKRQKLLQLDLGAIDLPISQSDISDASGQVTPPQPDAIEFKLPKPD